MPMSILKRGHGLPIFFLYVCSQMFELNNHVLEGIQFSQKTLVR